MRYFDIVLQSAGGTRWAGYVRASTPTRAFRLALDRAVEDYPDASDWLALRIN